MKQQLPYQKAANAWLKPRRVAWVAPEQGLGKSCITAVDIVPPATIVCPASLKLNWGDELAMWRPDLTYQVIRKAKDVVDLSVDVHVINYDIITKVDLPTPHTLLCDESQALKSYTAKRTKAVARLVKKAKRIRFISGTPIPNRPIELWPMMAASGVTKLSYFAFGRRYAGGWETPWGSFDVSGASRVEELQKLLEPYLLRITKANALPDLPPKSWRVIELDLPVDAREKKFNIDQIEPGDSVPFQAISDILKMNAERKLPLCIEYIENALLATQKVVVFAHHTHIIDQLMEALADYQPVKITGGVSMDMRHAAVRRFQNDPACRVFVGNIKAAGTGLTLTAASHVIFVEASWTPSDLDQAADRCHRIGQKDAVTVDLLTISKSIDSIVLHKALMKMEIINSLIKETDMSNNIVQAAQLMKQAGELFVAAAELLALAGDTTVVHLEYATGNNAEGLQEIQNEEVSKPHQKETKSTKATTTKKAAETTVPPVAEAKTTAKKPTLEDIRAGLAKLIAIDKREKATAILAELGAKMVSAIKESDYPKAMELIEKASA